MFRTRAALAVAACLAGVVSGSIAAAQADSTSTGATGTAGTTSTPATITVNGAGDVSADSSDSSASMHASYLTALGSAVSDAQAKATALAAQVGDSLGVVENITEQSNDGGYLCSGVVFAAGTAKGAPVPAVSPGSSKKKGHGKTKPKAGTLERATGATLAIPAIARIADSSSTSCTIEADVTVTYAMAPA
jgi:uncharacterized protein YggE